MLGSVLSAPTLSAVLRGCQAAPAVTTARKATFTPAQHDMVAAAAERIIPTTDTPGAIDAGVPDFIDLMMGEWYPEADKAAFLAGVQAADDFCRTEHGARFAACDPEQQNAVLAALEEEHRVTPEGTAPSARAAFYATLRELTLLGYYTSEIGATQELQVNPMGQWDGDVPFAEVGRSYST